MTYVIMMGKYVVLIGGLYVG